MVLQEKSDMVMIANNKGYNVLIKTLRVGL